jgi:hypothetical protein
MGVLITHQRGRSGLMEEDQVDTVVGQIQEHIYNLLDPDYVPPKPEEKPEGQEVQPSEDKQSEDAEEEVTLEPEEVEEVKGEEKIDGIREAAGVTRCPKCMGVMVVGEEMCFKCKKGH